MKSKTTYTIKYRRKREGKTNYKKRLNLLKSQTTRLIIRKTNTKITMQLIQYQPDGDKVITTTNSTELKKLGWTHSYKNIPAAYLTGLLMGKKAKEHKIQTAILDLGLNTPRKGSRIYSALKGIIDAEIKIPTNEEIFPTQERIQGEHITKYLEKHKAITQDFEKIKNTIKE